MTRRRRTRDEQHSDRWVVSYADFITLLLAFFVVMYSISSVNDGKFRVLSQSLEGIFRGVDHSFDPIQLGDIRARRDRRDIGLIDQTPSVDASTVPKTLADEEAKELKEIERDATKRFQELIADGELSVSSNRLWMEIEIQSGLLFASGSAQPGIDADPILEALATILKNYENPLHVEGFTDDRPIQQGIFPSNWELSAARAAGIVRVLAHFGVAPERMAAVGFGQYQPKVSNVSARGRSINRRVKIIVARDERVRKALTSYGSDYVSDDVVETILKEKIKPSTSGEVKEIETEQGVLFTQDPDG
ncbi:MAG: flagellar motor protein MotD [Motiliproteus sp.]|nr:flagellar motor protein MotD [Motiliproteus sp.]MCW9051743.1 flagellar motor protein MotD [Motiliproteus sp.]